MNIPTIFVIDDDSEVCKALKWLFESVRLRVETFHSPLQFLETFNPAKLGCIIIDIRMPEMSGLELVHELNNRKNQMPIIIITGHGDIPMAVKALKMGVSDFLTKPFDDQYLLDQIHFLIKQRITHHPIINKLDTQKRLDSLSKREREVLELVVNGRMNKQISTELNIATSTVELHRSKVMKKMNAKTLGELIKMYFCL